MITINIADDFSRYPFGRYRTDGPYSGQRFREEILRPAFQQGGDTVMVILDDAIGMGSSFLEESFGGLIRDGLDYSDVTRRLRITSTIDETRVSEIAQYIAEAADTPTPLRHARA